MSAPTNDHKVRILHLEPSREEAALIRRHLARANIAMDYERVATPDQYLYALQQRRFDLILAEHKDVSVESMRVINFAAEQCPDAALVLLSRGDDQSAHAAASSPEAKRISTDNLSRLSTLVQQAHRLSFERKERERIHQEWAQFIALSQDCFCVIGQDRLFKRLSPAWERLTGFSVETLQSAVFTQFIHADERPMVHFELEKMASGSANCSFESRFACKDGLWRWLQWNAGSSPDASLIYATARDISARKTAEDRVREQAALLNLTQEAIVAWDTDNKISFWNKGAERLHGMPGSEVIGGLVTEVLTGLNWSEVSARLSATGCWQGEVVRKSPALVAEARINSVKDAVGRPKSYLYVARDVTEKKDLETKFLRAQRLETIGHMASGIAHDLNNIFTPILLASGVLEGMIADDRQSRLLSTVKSSAQRGGDLVQQILLFARGRSDTTLQIGSVLKELANMLAETFPKSIRIESRMPSDLSPVCANATQVHQILLNLCVNARDAMPQGGLLRITAENLVMDDNAPHPRARNGLYVCLSVQDSGDGMSPEVMSRAFDPFFTTKAVGEGTGLGLHTVKSIVEQQEGFIDLSSEIGKGTTFKIFLPAVHKPSGSAPIKASGPAVKGTGQTILVVDDECGILEMTEALLRQAGYQVIAVPGGPQALSAISERKSEIALVIIDLVMPLLDGPATIRAFQNLHPDLPVIAMSGLAENQKRLENLANTRFLLKPFTPEQLLGMASEALRLENRS